MYNGKKLEDCDVVVSPFSGNTIDMKKALKSMSLAVSVLNSQYPFFSNLFRKLYIQWTFLFPTLAVDGVRLFVNPEFWNDHNIRQQVFLLMHETMHCALTHMTRAKEHGFDHWKGNIAADYEVNGLMVEDGLIKASDMDGMLYDKKVAEEKWSFERIYLSNLPGPPRPEQQSPDFDNQDQSDQSQDGDDGDSSSSNSDNKPKSEDWVDGWNDALDAYKAGKLKL